MKQKYINIILLVVFLITTVITYLILDNVAYEKERELKKQNYLTTSKVMQQQFFTLIEEKKHATLAIALLLSHDSAFKKALLNNTALGLDLNIYSKQLSQSSDFKHAWFHLISKDGISLSRSWSKKYGDSIVQVRKDVAKMIKNPQIMTSLGVGKFDLTFKAMVPIYNDKNFIGIFEVITHFNSISNKFLKKGIRSVIVVDKKYKKQLKKPFTDMFLGDYYIANENVTLKDLNIIKKYNIEFFIKYTRPYFLAKDEKVLIKIVHLLSIDHTQMAYAILLKPLNTIDMSKLSQIKTNMIFYILLFILSLGLLLYYISSKKYHTKLKQDQIQMKLILDAQPYIMILTDGNTITETNREFFHFFSKYNTIEEFLESYNCICSMFEKVDETDYISGAYINGVYWIDYVLDNPHKVVKVCMKKNEKLYHFIVKASQTDIIDNSKEKLIVVVFVDITKEIEAIENLTQKEKLLAEQSKMAAMGEMIGNIAHQWRQPLSVISTSATGMKMQKEFGVLTDEHFFNMCNSINENAQYLSRTIDDFRNFIKGDREKEKFNLNHTVESFLHLIEGSVKNHNIKIIKNIDKTINLVGHENELMQCFINIFNNAKDAMKDRGVEQRLFFIDINRVDDKKIEILFKDNALGIADDIILKIFEPYFTTKHQAQGTGLGLHMTYKIITEGMGGDIRVENITYLYNDVEYKGALFKIVLSSDI